MAVRVYRTELKGATSSGTPHNVRVYRTELLGSTAAVTGQVRVYRTELVGTRQGITYYDSATTSWLDAVAMWQYKTATSSWVQVF